MKNKYAANKLYIAFVAPISINGSKTCITSESNKGIYAVVKTKWRNRYYDLVREQTYYNLRSKRFGFLKRHINKLYVIELKLMKDYLKKNIDFLSDDEINHIFNELNGIEDNPKLDAGKESESYDTEIPENDNINDPFLREIIRTSEKIDDSIDPFLKEKFINELRQLAEEYVNMMINASENKAPLDDSKCAAQQPCIKKLVDIESRIIHSKSSTSTSNDLVADLKKLNLQIGYNKRK